MHKLSSRLLVLSCACFILLSVLSFFFSAADVSAEVASGDPSYITGISSGSLVYNGFTSDEPFTIEFSSLITSLNYCYSGRGSISFQAPNSGSRNQSVNNENFLFNSNSNHNVLTVVCTPSAGSSITVGFDSSQIDVNIPETAPPEYGDMLGMMTSGFSFVSVIWQGVIDLVVSNWLLVVGLVCFIAVFAISSIRRHYRS